MALHADEEINLCKNMMHKYLHYDTINYVQCSLFVTILPFLNMTVFWLSKCSWSPQTCRMFNCLYKFTAVYRNRTTSSEQISNIILIISCVTKYHEHIFHTISIEWKYMYKKRDWGSRLHTFLSTSRFLE